MAKLQTTVDSLQDEKLKALFNEIQEVRKMPKEDSLNTRKSSDLLVEFLRNLACASMSKSTNEVLVALLSEESYLTNMRDMKKMEHGGQPELIALQDTLGLDLRVVDAVVVGKKQATADSYLKDAQANTVYLLNTPAHYDIVYLK